MGRRTLDSNQIKGNAVSVKDYGALGDGSTDDSSAIQAAIDAVEAAGGGTVKFPYGDYRVSVTKGTNDKYGINIDSSNVALVGENGAQLRRLSSDISTYAKSFPILFIGKVDSADYGDQIKNIKVKGLTFVGENTRHTVSGSNLNDFRTSIVVRNSKNVRIINNDFESIDSSAIYMHKPVLYDYENAQYYGGAKCYDVKIINNRFEAESHSTNGRALLHAIAGPSDRLTVVHNEFEWCDVCVALDTTYDDYDDKETDTYTDSNLGSSVRRVGKGATISNNHIYNSSEHCFYLSGMNSTCTGNTIQIDNVTVCNTIQIQTRGKGITIASNTLTGVYSAINISTGSIDVTCTGNTIQAFGDPAGGVIQIASQGLTAFWDARPDYISVSPYKPMRNITITGNTIEMIDASQTNGYAFRIYTDTSDSNFPNGQMQNVTITGNTITGAKHVIYYLANLARRVRIQGNVFTGKSFTTTSFGTRNTDDTSASAAFLTDSTASFTVNEFVGWTIYNETDGSSASVTANTATTVTGTLSGGTDNDWDSGDTYLLVPPMNSVSVIALDDSLTASLQEVAFDNNIVHGFEYIFYSLGEAGSGMRVPNGIRGNTLEYIRRFSHEDFSGIDLQNSFYNNKGTFFLDRTSWFGNSAINNSMSDGTNSNSYSKTCIRLVSSTDVRIYHDDDGNFTQLYNP